MGIEPETGMEQESGAPVCTTVIFTTVVSTDLCHLRLNLCQLLIKPLHHLCACLILRISRRIEGRLEWAVVEEVQQIPVVEGAEEAYLCTNTLIGIIIGNLMEVEVILCDIVHQALVSPLYTAGRRVPADGCHLRDTGIVLPCPKDLIGTKLLKVESGTVEARLTGIDTHITTVVRTFLTGEAKHTIHLGKQALLIVCRCRLRVDRREVQLVTATSCQP